MRNFEKFVLIVAAIVFIAGFALAQACLLPVAGWVDKSDPEIPDMDRPYALFLSGNYLYVTNYYNGGKSSLSIIDVSNPDAPDGVGQVTNSDPKISSLDIGTSVFVLGNYAYVTTQDHSSLPDISGDGEGLVIIDVSNPSAPHGVSQLLKGEDADLGPWGLSAPYDIYVSGNYAFVLNFGAGISIIDVSDPAHPDGIAYITNADPDISRLLAPIAFFVKGNYAYAISIGDNSENPPITDALAVIDVSNPHLPDGVGQVTREDQKISEMKLPRDVFVLGNYAYVVSGGGLNGSLQIIDISNPANPVGVGQVTNIDPEISGTSQPQSVFVSGYKAFVANNHGGMSVIDVSDPAHPNGLGAVPSSFATGVTYSKDRAFVVSSGDGKIQVINTSQCPLITSPFDALETKITSILNEQNQETANFSLGETMAFYVKISNHFSASITDNLNVTISKSDGTIVSNFAPKSVTIESGSSIQEIYSFDWSGQEMGTYQITASMPVQSVEKNFAQNNNTANKFVTLWAQTNATAVPETNLFFAPIIAFAVIALIYYSSITK